MMRPGPQSPGFTGSGSARSGSFVPVVSHQPAAARGRLGSDDGVARANVHIA